MDSPPAFADKRDDGQEMEGDEGGYPLQSSITTSDEEDLGAEILMDT